jgi:tRNA-splicing ligase RtcB
MRVMATERIPIKMWLEDIESGALEQALHLANLPFAFKHIALMPDCHKGYGMPIGGVLATKNVVVPNAVGVDIGCGMCAMRTSLTKIEKEDLLTIIKRIKNSIPVGFNHHVVPQDERLMPNLPGYTETLPYAEDYPIVSQEYKSALHQLGTLGGGNHFIEFQKGDDDHIWVMIHSGSRNLGKKVADHYNKMAIFFNERWYSSIPKGHDLAFLPLETNEAKSYLREMQYCVDFALKNRLLMLEKIKEILKYTIHIDFEEPINIAHNYARFEHHYGENVLVHRKGATSARLYEIGIIPGSQGTKSYIVEGLGNKESFESCSHGAGRKMGRTQATKILSLEEEVRKLNEQGIIHGINTTKDLDEASGAYKDISDVMENQKDLVKIRIELRPLAVVKG